MRVWRDDREETKSRENSEEGVQEVVRNAVQVVRRTKIDRSRVEMGRDEMFKVKVRKEKHFANSSRKFPRNSQRIKSASALQATALSRY